MAQFHGCLSGLSSLRSLSSLEVARRLVHCSLPGSASTGARWLCHFMAALQQANVTKASRALPELLPAGIPVTCAAQSAHTNVSMATLGPCECERRLREDRAIG